MQRTVKGGKYADNSSHATGGSYDDSKCPLLETSLLQVPSRFAFFQTVTRRNGET